MNAPLAPVRLTNMRKRRARILDCARVLMASGGAEALNLRTLARDAGVTVPTIYNLVGNKEQVIVALFSEALTEVERRVGTHRTAPPLEQAEAVVTESVAVFSADEAFYRAAFVALEYLDQSSVHHVAAQQLFAWGERMLHAGCSACRAAGLLRGRIPIPVLTAQILRCYRAGSRAWAYGQISVDMFRDTALSDLRVCLAADAVDTFRATLLTSIGRPAARRRSRTRQHVNRP